MRQLRDPSEYGHTKRPLGNLRWKRIWIWQVEKYIRGGWAIAYADFGRMSSTKHFWMRYVRPVAYVYEVSQDVMDKVAADMKLVRA